MSNVRKLFTNEYAFAAILKNGQVVTWGDARFGGDSYSVRDRLIDVEFICSTGSAFAAKLVNVIAWGDVVNGKYQ